MLHATLDTNVFVSSLLVKEGYPAQVIDAWRERAFVVVVSPAIIAEVRSTLNYPRIRRRYAVTDDEIEGLATLLERDAFLVSGEAHVSGIIPDDPKDEIVLAAALDGKADLIVSGDHHLLDLEVFQGIPILTVRQFLDRLAEEGL